MPRHGLLLAFVLAAWLLAVAAIGVGGDFPLSDDWAYAHVVRSLAGGNGFDFLPWTGASLVVQALYGAAVTKAAGFSYVTLRLTTLALSGAAIVCFYALLRELGASRRVSAAGAASVAFSPLWLNLSFTFMTDVPFAALAVIAAWLYTRGLHRASRRDLLVASLVASAAFLVRQHGAWIAAAAALAAVMPLAPGRGGDTRDAANAGDAARASHAGDAAHASNTRNASHTWLDALAALGIPVAVAAAYTMWTITSPVVPLAVHNKLDEAASATMLTVANAAFRGVATAGFLLLPWSIAAGFGTGRRRALAGTIFFLLAATAVFLYAREGASMFYLSNMLGDLHIGPVTTRDVQFLGRDPGASGGPLFRLVLTAASLASAAVVAARLLWPEAAAGTAGRRRAARFCAAALVLSALGTLVQSHYFFDRYLIVLVPLAIAALAAAAPRLDVGAGFAAALLLLSLYAVAGTHDYMEWNRARWSLLADLEARGVGARSIDGGVEYNGERLAAELRTSPTDAEARRGQPASSKSWWWVVDDEWVIAFQDLDGYRRADSRAFVRWLPPGSGQVLALQRSAIR